MTNECECKRCGHKWTARKDNPARCPKCKSWYWRSTRIGSIYAILAKDAQVSRTTLYYIRRLEESPLAEDLRQKLESGELKIYPAYVELQRRESKIAFGKIQALMKEQPGFFNIS